MQECTLTENTIETFNLILDQAFKSRRKTKRMKDFEVIIDDYNKKNNKLPDTLCLPIHLKAVSMLRNLGYTNFDPNCIIFEFHRRNYCNDSFIKDITWHYDDGNVAPFNVYTVIFYLRKDVSVKGANLLYDLEETTSPCIRQVKVNEGKTVIFPGNLYHSPQAGYGFGCRDSIVVFIRRLD